MYICKICGDEFSKPYLLASHMKKHKREAIPQPVPEEVVEIPRQPVMVSVLSIGYGKSFEHEGIIYRKMKLISDMVIGWCGPGYYQDKAFDINTLVTPK